jgi:high-affinity nickel permease
MVTLYKAGEANAGYWNIKHKATQKNKTNTSVESLYTMGHSIIVFYVKKRRIAYTNRAAK